MKLTVLSPLISIVLLSISCNDNIKKNDLAVNNLYEDVKFIEYNTYYTVEKFGEISKGKLFWSSDITFNIKGNISEVNYYSPKGILESKTIIKYNDVGNKMETKIYSSDGLSHDVRYEKNVDNENYSYSRFNNDEIANESYHDFLKSLRNNKNSYKYDEKGKLIEIKTIDPEGILVTREINKYIDLGTY